jgi:gluconate 2-dehydrogenase gamma chain
MDTDLARRNFLKTAVVLVPATALLGACSSSAPSTASGPVYLTHAEADFVDAATQRLIPNDALGPGANEAGVTRFIDLQLAGAFGRAERWYMQGPWPQGTDSQGFQLKYTPAQIYRQAIAGIDAHCRQQYAKPFAQLAGAQQDSVLTALEQGTIDLPQIPARTFFALLWQNTQEAFLADPVYGGNRQFAGWRLIGFPGPRYNYVEEIGRFGQRYGEPFVSLDGRLPTSPEGAPHA